MQVPAAGPVRCRYRVPAISEVVRVQDALTNAAPRLGQAHVARIARKRACMRCQEVGIAVWVKGYRRDIEQVLSECLTRVGASLMALDLKIKHSRSATAFGSSSALYT